MPRPLIFMIDLEPDGRGDVRDDPWAGTHIAIPQFAALRQRLQQITGAEVHFNWFPRYDPQIERTFGGAWMGQRFPELLETMRSHGDLAGLHVHFWRWHEGRQSWFNDFADAAWMRECIELSVARFQEQFAEAPIASRAGDRWTSQAMFEILRDVGVRYDLSLEPGLPSRPLTDDRYATAPTPSTRECPREPHRVSTPSGELWLVPTTTSREDYWLPQRSFPFLRRASQPFNLALRPKRLWQHMAAELERTTAEPLVFVVRSGDLAKPSSLTAFQFVMQRLTQHPALPASRFLRVDAAIDRFLRA